MSTKLETLTAELGITMAVKYGAPENDTFRDSDGWTCTLKRGRKRYTLPFYQGYGHNGAEPTIAAVLSCLVSDADCADNARSFEDFASDLGYDPDSRKAEAIYRACLRTSKRLHALLGEDFERVSEAAREY